MAFDGLLFHNQLGREEHQRLKRKLFLYAYVMHLQLQYNKRIESVRIVNAILIKTYCVCFVCF